MIRKAYFLLLLLVVGCNIPSTAARLAVHAMAELDSLQKIEERPALVFIHTNWCRYCQAMEHTTFRDRDIVSILNEKFWFVSFDAESKSDILYNGQTYHYKPTGNNTGVHDLAQELGSINGELSYPAICVLGADRKIIFQYNQYLSAKDLMRVLQQ